MISVVLTLNWRDVKMLTPFVMEDTARPALSGVRVELDKGRGELACRLIAIDGKRMVVLQSQAALEGDWPSGVDRAFTLPLDLVKRVKKVGSGDFELALVTLDLDWRAPSEDPEEVWENRLELTKVTVAAVCDPLVISQKPKLGDYVDWRKSVPEGPFVPAEDVQLNGSYVSDFAEVLWQLERSKSVGFYRGAKVDGGMSPLVIRSGCERFFGVVMPVETDWEGTLELPLWFGAG